MARSRERRLPPDRQAGHIFVLSGGGDELQLHSNKAGVARLPTVEDMLRRGPLVAFDMGGGALALCTALDLGWAGLLAGGRGVWWKERCGAASIPATVLEPWRLRMETVSDPAALAQVVAPLMLSPRDQWAVQGAVHVFSAALVWAGHGLLHAAGGGAFRLGGITDPGKEEASAWRSRMEQRSSAVAPVFDRLLASGALTLEQLANSVIKRREIAAKSGAVLEVAQRPKAYTEFRDGLDAAGIALDCVGTMPFATTRDGWEWADKVERQLPADKQRPWHNLIAAVRATGASSFAVRQKCVMRRAESESGKERRTAAALRKLS